jgi:hypothetical protein
LKKDLCQFEEKVGSGQPGIELGSKRIPGNFPSGNPPDCLLLKNSQFRHGSPACHERLQYAHLAPAHKLAAVDRLAEYRKEQEMAA